MQRNFYPFQRIVRALVYKIYGYEIIQHHLTKEGKLRLEWMDWYKGHGENASLTCRHFGISRKTFYKWQKRYKLFGLKGLDDKSKAPKKVRQPEISQEQEKRVIKIRKEHIRYGKKKIKVLYEKEYGESISTWKIYRIIRERNLYYHPVKNELLRKRRKLAEKKKRITELQKKAIKDLLFQMDTKVIWCNPEKRYIFTAIERDTKIAFARMYKNNSSYCARDFLLRLYFLLDGNIQYLHSDNGSEFAKYFDQACAELQIPHYFSRVRTPKDHAEIERFNRTLEEEFLQIGHYIDDPEIFNPLLTEWLIEYNFKRPHESLKYQTPFDFFFQHQKVLPMYPTCTNLTGDF